MINLQELIEFVESEIFHAVSCNDEKSEKLIQIKNILEKLLTLQKEINSHVGISN